MVSGHRKKMLDSLRDFTDLAPDEGYAGNHVGVWTLDFPTIQFWDCSRRQIVIVQTVLS